MNSKQAVGYAAAEFVRSGMRVGLGTGSTAYYFIEKLIEKYRAGLRVEVVASSRRSEEQARAGGLPLIDVRTLTELDLTVDGADEIDGAKRMIKGGGGALVREKILACMSHELIVIVDESKCVHTLGAKVPLPVEILPFASEATLHHIQRAGYTATWREGLSDNGNRIADLRGISDIAEAHETLIHIPGVVDTGFFCHLAGRVLVGYADGQVVTRP